MRDVLLKIGFRKAECDFSAFTRFEDLCDEYSMKSQVEAVQPHKNGSDVMQKYSQRYCQMRKNATTAEANTLSHSLTASATVDSMGF